MDELGSACAEPRPLPPSPDYGSSTWKDRPAHCKVRLGGVAGHRVAPQALPCAKCQRLPMGMHMGPGGFDVFLLGQRKAPSRTCVCVPVCACAPDCARARAKALTEHARGAGGWRQRAHGAACPTNARPIRHETKLHAKNVACTARLRADPRQAFLHRPRSGPSVPVDEHVGRPWR